MRLWRCSFFLLFVGEFLSFASIWSIYRKYFCDNHHLLLDLLCSSISIYSFERRRKNETKLLCWRWWKYSNCYIIHQDFFFFWNMPKKEKIPLHNSLWLTTWCDNDARSFANEMGDFYVENLDDVFTWTQSYQHELNSNKLIIIVFFLLLLLARSLSSFFVLFQSDKILLSYHWPKSAIESINQSQRKEKQNAKEKEN